MFFSLPVTGILLIRTSFLAGLRPTNRPEGAAMIITGLTFFVLVTLLSDWFLINAERRDWFAEHIAELKGWVGSLAGGNDGPALVP